MTLSRDEYILYLQSYFPDEIEKAICDYGKRAWEHDENTLNICEILNLKLPAQRQLTDKTISNAIKGCTNVLQMPKQLTNYEKFELMKHSSFNSLKAAFMEIEDNSNYRKGESVFLAVKKNLEFYNNWK